MVDLEMDGLCNKTTPYTCKNLYVQNGGKNLSAAIAAAVIANALPQKKRNLRVGWREAG